MNLPALKISCFKNWTRVKIDKDYWRIEVGGNEIFSFSFIEHKHNEGYIHTSHKFTEKSEIFVCTACFKKVPDEVVKVANLMAPIYK